MFESREFSVPDPQPEMTATGSRLLSVVPSPSWPELL